MIPLLATLVCLAFIAYLFWTDVRKRDRQSISWVPLIWMFLAGSRWVSSWLNLSSPIASIDDYAEGSPVDRAVFFLLIVWGVVVLVRRNVDWRRLLSQNALVVLYLSYCLLSIVWTDQPFVLLKRWFKDLGNPIMALVILTEARPYEAAGTLLRRLAFLLLPLSVLFIRYFPELGRSYRSDGSPMYTGVGHQKNDLGLMCLLAGIYFGWKILQPRQNGGTAVERADIRDYTLMAMLGWLLYKSNSQTSLVCLIAATGLMLLARRRFIASQPSRLVPIVAVGGLVWLVLDSTVHIKDQVLAMLGRDPTFTSRVDLWDLVKSQGVNPVVGAGFMTFWSGDRMRAIWDALGAGINQAHNGYLEQFVNLGYIGVIFIVALMLTALGKIRRQLKADTVAALLRFSFLIAAVLYNFTEASFYGINNMWLLLLVASIDTHGALAAPARGSAEQPNPAVVQQSTMDRSPHRWRPSKSGAFGSSPTGARVSEKDRAIRPLRAPSGGAPQAVRSPRR